MLLAIDVGNTNVTIGAFEGQQLAARWSLATDVQKMPDEYGALLQSFLEHRNWAARDFSASIICSSVPPLVASFEEMLERYFKLKPLVVGPGIKTGIRILYENPREVGPDRIADAVAAFRLYRGPIIIVDFGTATTVEAVSKDGDYLGGAIAPGLAIAAEALFQRAARLHRIELVKPAKVIGRNTDASMQSGIVYGYVGLVEGLVARFREELGTKARVIATGGLAPVIATQTPVVDVIDVDLTLQGLRFLYELNT